MGNSLWHYATISHILKNRLYCGELEYRKEYVPDYLEQKRAKNNGELDRIIVEGKHQPIVTKEEFEKVQKLIEEKRPQMEHFRKNRGIHSDDLWRRKLRCQCGHAFAKTRWHSKSRDFTTYTYKCYDQTRTGTVPARLKNGLGIENVCRSPLVQDWKMYTMAQKVLHAVFDDPEGTLLDAAAVLGCGIAGVDVSGKMENLQRLMEQPPVPEDGEFSEEDIDKYVFGVRVYEDRFEWLLNLSPEARGELDDAGSPVYFTKLTVTPDDERAWFRMHPQWSKSNKYAELEAWIYI